MRILILSFKQGMLWLLLMILGFTLNAQGKTINKEKHNKYSYDGMAFKYSGLEYILQQSPDAYSYFKKYKSRKKTSKILGYTALGLIGSGILIGEVMEDVDCSSGGICANQVYGALIGISAIIPGTTALVIHFRSNSLKGKSIDAYNSRELAIDSISLELRPTKNGLGILLSF